MRGLWEQGRKGGCWHRRWFLIAVSSLISQEHPNELQCLEAEARQMQAGTKVEGFEG